MAALIYGIYLLYLYVVGGGELTSAIFIPSMATVYAC